MRKETALVMFLLVELALRGLHIKLDDSLLSALQPYMKNTDFFIHSVVVPPILIAPYHYTGPALDIHWWEMLN